MAGKTEIKDIQKDFQFLKDDERILAVLLFGSRASEDSHQRSDTDVCIVAPEQEPKDILMKIFRNLDVHKKEYDVHIFEELPLYIKISIIRNHRTVFSRDKYELSEYFYFYRKLWKDQERRNTMTRKEVMASLPI